MPSPLPSLKSATSAAPAKALLTSALLLSAAAAPLLGAVPEAAAATQLVVNGTFESGTTGWRTNQSYTTLATTTAAHDGTKAVVLRGPAGTNAVLNDASNTVASTTAATPYQISAWVRTDVVGLSGQLRVREVSSSAATSTGTSFHLTDTAWHRVDLSYTARGTGNQVDLNVLAWDVAQGQGLFVDTVSMAVGATTTGTTGTMAHTLEDGSAVSGRGVPAPGHALVGAAVGSNTDPTTFEQQVGQRLGVRRTYWRADQVSNAVRVARTDLAAGRLPWMSFKLPYSWSAMAAGQGDAWAKDIATQMSKLPGPVWIAFYHEPEGDGPIGDWKRMQERLGPIVRAAAPNVGFTVVLTGWNQLYGPAQYHLDAMWPNTKVDVAGFDIYNSYGTTNDHGTYFSTPTDLRAAYFEPISAWAKSKGVAWGLAETAINDQASVDYPKLLGQTYTDLVGTGGVAFSYFNTDLHSASSWVITTQTKRNQYAGTLDGSPTFPKIS